MAEWIVCPHCQLRHTRRPGGTCPRCRRALEVEAPVTAARQTMPDVFDEEAFNQARRERERAASPAEEAVPAAVRMGGAILLVNGMLQLAVRTLESSAAGAASVAGPWLASFDVVVGGILLSGQGQVRRWASVRAAVGGLGLGALHLLAGHAFAGLLQGVFAVGLLLLLIHRANWLRAGLGMLTATAAVLVGLSATAPYLGFRNPLGRLAARLDREIDPAPTPTLSGRRIGYTLSFPDGRWHLLRTASETPSEPTDEPEGAETDDDVKQEASPPVRRPDVLLDLQLLSAQLPPEASIDQPEAIAMLVEEARDGLPELMVVEDAWIDTAQGPMRVLEGVARVEGGRAAVALGFGSRGQCLFVLTGRAPHRIYPKVRDDLLEVFGSVQLSGC